MPDYQLVVLTGPSGAGKSSLQQFLLKRGGFIRCITCTTRDPRENEKDGVDYHFLTTESFEKSLQAREFVEHSFHYNHWYGVRLQDIESCLGTSHTVIALNWQGAMVLKDELPNTHIVYIEPPSMDVLKERLGNRGCNNRFEYAEEDLKYVDNFEHHLVNDDFKKACEELEGIVNQILSK